MRTWQFLKGGMMRDQQKIQELARAIKALEETIIKARKEWSRELKRTRELLKKLDAPD